RRHAGRRAAVRQAAPAGGGARAGHRPSLLLLDEPAAGLRAAEIEGLNDILLRVRRERGLSILVIDHVMALVMKISDRITVLNFGQKIAEGRPEEVRRSPAVIKAYLGERGRDAVLA
ncbi:ABC transporter ATP-binding protein C-terminal domain-containing protein, partial [Bordetella pertussis]